MWRTVASAGVVLVWARRASSICCASLLRLIGLAWARRASSICCASLLRLIGPAIVGAGGAAAAAATHDAASALALALTRVTTRKLRAIRCSPCTNTRIRGAFSTKRAVAHAVVSVSRQWQWQ